MYVYRVVVVMVRRIIAQAAGSLLFDDLVYVFFLGFRLHIYGLLNVNDMRKHQVHRGDQTNKKNEIDIGMMMEQADTTYKLCWGDGWFWGWGWGVG